jgi:signal transduction histidine kinase/DNA-binding response OmpR family regulator
VTKRLKTDDNLMSIIKYKNKVQYSMMTEFINLFRQMKIRTKILATSLAIGFLPVIAIGYFSLVESRDALSRQAFGQLESILELKKGQVESLFNTRQQDMQVLLNVVSTFQQNAFLKFETIQENKINQLQSYFRERANDIAVLAESSSVVNSLQQYEEALFTQGESASALDWQKRIAEQFDNEFRRYLVQGYHDILLVSAQGQILYSANRSEEQGQNILQGALQTTGLSRAFRRGKTQFIIQDFSAHSLAENPQIAFLAMPAYNTLKEVNGVIIMALTPNAINEIMQQYAGMGDTGESYLIGLSNNRFSYRSQGRANYHSNRTMQFGTELTGDTQFLRGILRDNKAVLDLKANEIDFLRAEAISPVNITGLDWLIVTTVKLEEVLSPKQQGERDDFFTRYVKQYNYRDLFLIHPDGLIFYSVAREADYNTNIISGKYANTPLGQVVREVLKTRTLGISDFDLYPPSNNLPAAFMALPLIHGGEIKLIVALQMSNEYLNDIMEHNTGMGETGETYLVGSDYLLRSDSLRHHQEFFLKNALNESLTRRIDSSSVKAALAGEVGKQVTLNYVNEPVLSAYVPIKVGQHQWALLAEISKREAFAPIRVLQWGMGFTALAITFIVLFMINRFSRRLVTPLLQIREHLKLLSQGRITKTDIIYKANDEIAEIIQSVRLLKDNTRETIEQTRAIASGNYDKAVMMRSDEDELGRALLDMTSTLRQAISQTRTQDWLKGGQAQLNDTIRGEQDLAALARNIITFLCTYLKAPVGTFYILQEPNSQHSQPFLKLYAAYAFQKRKHLANEFEIGDGMVGQAALENQSIFVTEIPDDYLSIQSSLGSAPPSNLLIMPFSYESELKGVLEIGMFADIDAVQFEFLMQAMPIIGIAVQTAESRNQMQALLQQTQQQAEELQSQAEELQSQQEELRQANEELQARTQALELQKEDIRQTNEALEISRTAIEQKAQELELASKYKSEFLANMSHELRTPLNSLLILAQLLIDNKTGTMTEKQVEYARTILSAGSDLLSLINEILDLAKVEAGKVEAHIEQVELMELLQNIEQKFRHLAEEKNLTYELNMAGNLPTHLFTDGQRLKQIVNNLLSNAFKFTSQGSIKMLVTRPTPEMAKRLTLPVHSSIAIAISDTGIGIAKDKQQVIFEAFQQAEGSTNRRYGGTGLGLSISRQLSRLLGGELLLESELGKGSTFILCIPEQLSNVTSTPSIPNSLLEAAASRSNKTASVESNRNKTNPVSHTETIIEHSPKTSNTETQKTNEQPEQSPISDDREKLNSADKLILIVDDDRKFSNVLMELAHEKEFKCLIAEDGLTALTLAKQYQPDAIILDIGLPGMDGWGVMEKLKDNPELRHIPVHFMSAADENRDARRMGAIGYLLKPISMEALSSSFRTIEHFIEKTVRSILIVTDSDEKSREILSLIEAENVSPIVTKTCAEATQQLSQQSFECAIIDVDVEKAGQGLQLLVQWHDQDNPSQVPVILYSDRELNAEEEILRQRCEDRLTIKEVKSPERLLDEATLFLHQVSEQLPPEKRSMLQRLHDREAIFNGKRILLVDDDIRNTYALATFLEGKNMEVLVANNGQEGLDTLAEESPIDLVLMDIMMPEMDGYEAMQKIRQQPELRKLPIIALTAKAMKGDKARCIEAGANDYLTKPVDTDRLLSLMRVWLYQ